MTPAEREAVKLLRYHGYAVCVFGPYELRGIDPRQVEDLMAERGHQAISDLEFIVALKDNDD